MGPSSGSMGEGEWSDEIETSGLQRSDHNFPSVRLMQYLSLHKNRGNKKDHS